MNTEKVKNQFNGTDGYVEKIVNVSVATLWTKPESPRELDQPALKRPADIRGWLNSMNFQERLDLCTSNLVQSQALYGARVIVLEEQGDWARVLLPEQSCKKDKRGYPGWMPLNQLSTPSEEYRAAASIAVVTRPLAFLHDAMGKPSLELSYLTRLPVVEQGNGWVTVLTPDGPQRCKAEDVVIYESLDQISLGNGEQIVTSAEMFLDLRYLWGGMSAFGYDCSGFAYSMHLANGYFIPRDASDQALQGEAIERKDLLPGDLLFFAYEEGKGFVHHVGIYIGNDQMIHSPNTEKSVEIITLTGTGYEKELSGARRYW